MTGSEPARGTHAERTRQKAVLRALIATGRSAVLVVNTRSRRGQRLYVEARRLLIEKGIILAAEHAVSNPALLPGIVQDAIAQGHRFIIIGAGDGTISSVVDYFAYKEVVLGVLPLGTANSFARTLNLPLDLPGAVDVLVGGRVADVDLGKINGDYFANGAAIGLPAVVGREVPHLVKKLLGRLGYLIVGAVQFLRFEPFLCFVTHDGDKTSLHASEIRIANGRYQGGVLVAPDASLESRTIEIQILTGRSKWVVAGAWLRILLGLPRHNRDCTILRAQDVLIDTAPSQHVSIDGEIVAKTPIRVSVAQEALLLMVPRSVGADA